MKRIIILLAILLVMSTSVFAQNSISSVGGRVVDKVMSSVHVDTTLSFLILSGGSNGYKVVSITGYNEHLLNAIYLMCDSYIFRGTTNNSLNIEFRVSNGNWATNDGIIVRINGFEIEIPNSTLSVLDLRSANSDSGWGSKR